MDRPADRIAVRDVIRERIFERILDGTYPAGFRVVQSHLASEFGTTHAPVREALRDLEDMRFIKSQPHAGAQVRAVTVENLGQIYPVRAALEELAGRAAASRITDEALAALGEELQAMRCAAEAGEIHRQLVHDARFHEIIVETSGNPALLEAWRSLRVMGSTLVSVIKAGTSLRMIVETHQPLLDALRSGDPELAGRKMRAHIEFFGSFAAGPRAATH
ncbi:MAG TPA: GntR family transcriptional regulator [Streptosporangiaceae bacterium]|nr:GntR family transcriptional regulator [Streptosporangiaceae bacterium]